MRQIRLQAAEGRPARAELLNQTRDGRRFWVEIDAHPLFDARRKRLGHVTIATDITDQVNLRARLRTVFDNVACGLLIYDSSGYIIDGNPEAQQLLGQPRERLLDMWLDHPGVQLLDEHGQALPPEHHPVMRTVREGQGLRDLVVGHTGADGAVRWLLMHTQRYAPDDLSQPGVIVSLIDITQRREHEQTLRVARDEARDALAQVHGYQQALDTHAGVIVTDAQGHIGSANARFCEQCGYAEHELLGQNPSLLRSELNPPGYFTDLWNTIASGDPWSGEICNRAKDGSLYWVGGVGVNYQHVNGITLAPIRLGVGLRTGASIGYLRTSSGYEIDFHADFPDGSIQIIQVCADLSSKETLEREVRALLDAQGAHPQATPLLARKTQHARDLQELLFALIVLADDRAIAQVAVAGRLT